MELVSNFAHTHKMFACFISIMYNDISFNHWIGLCTMNSNLVSMFAPEPLLSKIHTGSLLDNLGEAMQAEVLGKRFIERPLVMAKEPLAINIQQTLMACSFLDIEQGRFIRTKLIRGGRHKLGPMGRIANTGYIGICVANIPFQQSHLINLWFTGDLLKDKEQMDHIDGIRDNDYPGNLRKVSNKLNSRNRKKHCNNTSGYTGVYFDLSCSLWYACIMVNGKNFNIGFFYTKKEAYVARETYIAAHPELGFTVRHGK